MHALVVHIQYMNNQVHRALCRKEGEGKKKEKERKLQQPQHVQYIMRPALDEDEKKEVGELLKLKEALAAANE